MSFIAFILFVLCYFNLFCRYLSKHDAKKGKNSKPLTRQHSTARSCGGTTMPVQTLTKPAKTRSEGTARACGGTAVRDTPSPIPQKKSSFFFLIQTPQRLSNLSLNLHNLNLQISITLSKLHQITQFLNQINFKLHPKPNPPIKNNNHQSQPINHQIRVTTLTQTPPFPHKILPKPNLHPNHPNSN